VTAPADAFAAARRLRLRGIAEGRALTGPQTVHVDLANGCNTNCTTCWDHSPLLDAPRSIAWKRRAMSYEAFEGLARDLASMGSVEAVILSGMGDPFVNPDVYGIVDLAKRLGWHVTVLTNALLADARRVLDLDVDMLLVSVNGVSPASYAAFHPNLGAGDFERLCGLLEAFARAGKRFKHVQVINRDTAGEVPEMIRFAHRYAAAHVTFKLASLGGGTERCAITDEQRRALVERLVPEARREAERLGVAANLDVFEAQLRAGGLATAPISEVGCFMGWTYARVTVDGRILFCCSTEVEVGHLERGLFSEQWYGAAWDAVRGRLMRGEYYASCSQCGKLNQNVKIGRKVREKLGDEVYLARTGRGVGPHE
jgi:MoaA/NifB/PqqE/SkfB family radical SAM enzyme